MNLENFSLQETPESPQETGNNATISAVQKVSHKCETEWESYREALLICSIVTNIYFVCQ